MQTNLLGLVSTWHLLTNCNGHIDYLIKWEVTKRINGELILLIDFSYKQFGNINMDKNKHINTHVSNDINQILYFLSHVILARLWNFGFVV